ncbi:hypothetical protein DPMN_194579 [Dreissena polymorpha]|uniref:Uncharacterized protein n=1 Tax=Dreissena polymorpha TaxID=45954 RepID=A0A9D3Y6S7_DREPO|nr:hypothetical protein DPMN_194579 [Dreissena polymorpha]
MPRPLGGHVSTPTGTIFELIQNIIGTNRLTKFHDDRTINVASRVKNAPPPGGHVFKTNETIFELIQYIIGTNLLTKFHEDRTINVASRVKNSPPLGSHVFQANIRSENKCGLKSEKCLPPGDIIGINLQTKFHEDHTIKTKVASRVKNAPPLGSHVFQANITIFKLIQDIIETNLLTKFHDDWTINVASRVLTIWPYIIGTNLLTKFHEDRKINVASRVLTRKNALPLGSHFNEDRIIDVAPIVKNAPPLGSHVFQANATIFELVQHIIGMNLLTKFHKDWTINVASRVLTRKNARPPGGHDFKATKTILNLIQDIIGTNLLTKFHEDRKINVASRVLKRKCPPPGNIIVMNLLTKFNENQIINVVPIVKKAPVPWQPCFQGNATIFKLVQHIIGMILLTKVLTRNNALPPGGHFHENRKINVASRPYKKKCPDPWRPCFQPTCIIFELIQHIIGMNLLTRKYSPPLGSHVFQANTNLLTKFHDDWTINVASRVLTRQMLTPHNGRLTKGNHKSSP